MKDPQLDSLTDRELDDDDAYRDEVNGDEAVGGTTAMPSQNDTEELAAAAGITFDDDTPIAIEETIEQRDRDRWELDPDSVADE
ncbi:DUF6335 family protein [Chamaesiphon polymorphus]|uniref:Uncharacterized protein n=1 Tax=Chamaesiphon polymorphus CCALA 037 TaxID=2107692 RepID=A0A2T1GN85_9CYAN|nr:DUF6335 family protein [Chamaesiphon polymorphus]PSB59321.1 hypothetical protein C7B77_01370 [Chamaesiphon polymorphus CCALA 037]